MITMTRAKVTLILILTFITLLVTQITQAQDSSLDPNIINDFKFFRPGQGLTGRIAFTAKVGQFQRIFVLDLKAGSIRPLVTGPGNNSYPSWSPDGTELAFTSDRTGHDEIFKINWNAENLVQLTKQSGNSLNPDWSKDGKTITYYYSTSNQAEDTQLAQLSLADQKSQLITNYKGKQVTPRLSPDNKVIAYSTNRFWPGWDVCTFNLTSKKETCPLGGKDSFCRPYWSNDGKKMLFANGFGTAINIGFLDLTTSASTQLTSLQNREYDPVWGPNEMSIFFVGEPEASEKFNLYVLFLGEKNPLPLVVSPYPIRYPAWDSRSTLELEAKRIREQSLIKTPRNIPTNLASPIAKESAQVPSVKKP